MISIEPYNPARKTGFARLKLALEQVLQGYPVDIQHVGSTAIPGLPAKPILDIDIIIKDLSLLNEISRQLEQAGYINRGDQGIPGRYAFRQRTSWVPAGRDLREWPEHHLYVCLEGCLALRNHLLFRDALLQDKSLVMQYARLKERLSGLNGISRESYTQQKTEFILEVLRNQGLPDVELSAIRAANS